MALNEGGAISAFDPIYDLVTVNIKAQRTVICNVQYVRYIHGLCQSRLSAARYAVSYLTDTRNNGNSVTWTILNPTTTKFKPLNITYVGLRLTQFREHIDSYEFFCCLHNFVMESYIYGILKATRKSRLGMRSGYLPVVRRTLFCRPFKVRRLVSATDF
jgi:hypothetical protein